MNHLIFSCHLSTPETKHQSLLITTEWSALSLNSKQSSKNKNWSKVCVDIRYFLIVVYNFFQENVFNLSPVDLQGREVGQCLYLQH